MIGASSYDVIYYVGIGKLRCNCMLVTKYSFLIHVPGSFLNIVKYQISN